MLVLTRKVNQAIVIYVGGKRIAVRVNSASGRTVKLAVEASRDVKVLREELMDRTD